MRLKHVPQAEGIIKNSSYSILNPEENKGQWKLSFNNDNPINIEIGMGKGKFIIEKANENPNINYIGIEKYSSVLYKAVQQVEELSITNLRFLCNDAGRLADYFEKEEVKKIYLNFSDPWPKARHSKRRLTSHTFLDIYEKILPKDGKIEFKTDNIDLFNFSLDSFEQKDGWKILAKTYDLWDDPMLSFQNITTEYEEKFVANGQKICKLVAVYEG